MKFNKQWIKYLSINVLSMIILGVLLLVFLFNMYLPSITNHGETITVPDLEGRTIDELDEFLSNKNLRFEVTEDSGYSSTYPPMAVLKQFPLPNAKVKEGRKIYVSLNAKNPPLVRMPLLIDGSVKNAQLVLRTYDLQLGDIKYVPDIAANAVLEQYYNGDVIKEGDYVPKGAKIDLEAGDGLGNQIFESPYLTDLSLEDAQFAIIGSGLKVGDIYYEKNGIAMVELENEEGEMEWEEVEIKPGNIFKQKPTPGRKVKLGQAIDLWVVDQDTSSTRLEIIN